MRPALWNTLCYDVSVLCMEALHETNVIAVCGHMLGQRPSVNAQAM